MHFVVVLYQLLLVLWLCFFSIFGFFIFRSLLKQRLERLLLRYPKAAAVESAVTAKGLSLMILLRLGPFNFSMLNAVLGASNVRFAPFLLSLVGVIPGNSPSGPGTKPPQQPVGHLVQSAARR